MSSYCKVWINGQEVEADEERKLMDVLRNDLRLKSVKDGCSEGACGTCTVLIDGKATKSCVQKMGRLAGKHILTVGCVCICLWRNGSGSVRFLYSGNGDLRQRASGCKSRSQPCGDCLCDPQ